MTKSKIVSVDEAVAEIPDGAKVALGGWIFNSQPMALVRALIRKGARDLHLIPAPGSIAPDMLIGAGCVASTVCVFISFEQFGLAPHFRRHAESGALKVYDLDGPGIAGGLRAGICDLPYMPVPDLWHRSAEVCAGALLAAAVQARRAQDARCRRRQAGCLPAARPAGRRAWQRSASGAAVLRRDDGPGVPAGHRLGRSHRVDRHDQAQQSSDQAAERDGRC